MHDTAQHSIIQQHTATHCNTLQHTATHCNTLQHNTTHCDALQDNARGSGMQFINTLVLRCFRAGGSGRLHYNCKYCRTVHVCTHCCADGSQRLHYNCNTLPHTATHYMRVRVFTYCCADGSQRLQKPRCVYHRQAWLDFVSTRRQIFE